MASRAAVGRRTLAGAARSTETWGSRPGLTHQVRARLVALGVPRLLESVFLQPGNPGAAPPSPTPRGYPFEPFVLPAKTHLRTGLRVRSTTATRSPGSEPHSEDEATEVRQV